MPVHKIGLRRLIKNGFTQCSKFEKIEGCCKAFESALDPLRFEDSSYSYYDSKPGFNLLSRGSEIKLMICGSSGEHAVNYCPFCPEKIEIKETSTAELKEKKKLIHDGYEQVNIKKV